jgi:ankyrin repeat protein
LRHLGWTISDAAFLEELNNRPEAVVSWDLANIRMGRQMMGHGALVQNLVGTAIESIGILGLDRLIANTELPAPTLQRIVEKAREAESSREVMRDILAREELYLAGEKGGDLERAQQFAREIRRSMDIPLHVYLAEEAVRKSLELDLDFGTPMRVAEWANARRNFGTMDAQLRVLQIRAAIAIFQQQAGRLPEKLDELVPAILPSIPLDPFSGKPLRYARTDDGWKVWSVGFDLKDHGGMINSASRFTTWTEGSDAVFPSKLPNTLQWRARRSGASVPKPQRDATGDLLGLTPLHYAANRGDAAEVARLLAAGADVNAKGNCGQTPLHLAATAAVANLLLEHGADLNAMSDFTTTFNIFRAPGTPLGWAIFGDRRDVVEVLLDANATRDFPGNSNALESAVGLDRNEIVTMLIKKGEKINEALHYAVGSGNIAMAGKLISAGAMVGAQELSKAIEERDWDMAEFCLAKGGKLDIFSASALGKLKEAETLIADDPSLVKQADAKKWTALHWAAFAGQKQIVAFLVSKGADVNQKESGETPLQVAIANAMWPWQGGNLIAARHGEKGKALDAEGTFRELLDCGADVDARNAYGQTPLIVAVYQMNPTAAEALIKKGADVNIKDDSGKTALDYAKETEKDGPADSMTKLLESHGAK